MAASRSAPGRAARGALNGVRVLSLNVGGDNHQSALRRKPHLPRFPCTRPGATSGIGCGLPGALSGAQPVASLPQPRHSADRRNLNLSATPQKLVDGIGMLTLVAIRQPEERRLTPGGPIPVPAVGPSAHLPLPNSSQFDYRFPCHDCT